AGFVPVAAAAPPFRPAAAAAAAAAAAPAPFRAAAAAAAAAEARIARVYATRCDGVIVVVSTVAGAAFSCAAPLNFTHSLSALASAALSCGNSPLCWKGQNACATRFGAATSSVATTTANPASVHHRCMLSSQLATAPSHAARGGPQAEHAA